MIESNGILEFWLGEAALSAEHAKQQKKLWYRSSHAIDQEIERKFSGLHRSAVAGELDHWRNESNACLALVILLDQFSRHLYRGKPDAFAQDDLALEIARNCPHAQSLPLIARAFLFHPYEHSEHLAAQTESVALFAQLAAEADEDWRPMMQDFHKHAQEHYEIVTRFGRFPHRNAILGRTNTKDEQRYIDEGGKSFGQKVKQ